ncbi:MAG: hypothetical protein LC667_04020 [Thioalkalivibrio sp.]|nr:hypothetical protein [Thioalkalivibrio sp.]
MSAGAVAGLLLRDAAELHDIARPELPQLDARPLAPPSTPPAETGTSRQAAADSWSQWWPTAIQHKHDPEASLASLATSSPFWRTYLAEQQPPSLETQMPPLELADQLKTDWSRAELPRLRQPGGSPEGQAARQALADCHHRRTHRHEAEILVLPTAEPCFVALNQLVVVDNDQRHTDAYVQRLAAHLRQLWE